MRVHRTNDQRDRANASPNPGVTLPRLLALSTHTHSPTHPPTHHNNYIIMNEDLADEVSALNSIYGESCITRSSSGTYILRAPTRRELTLTLLFPTTYPLSPPEILDGAGGGGGGGGRGFGGGGFGGKELARDVLRTVWRAGEVCLYDLVEGLRELELELELEVGVDEAEPEQHEGEDEKGKEGEKGKETDQHPWVVADPLVEKKSVFVGRAIAVHSAAEAKQYVSDLLAGNRKVAKATHNMTGTCECECECVCGVCGCV